MTDLSSIEAGTTVAWSRLFDLYPSATWTLQYRLVSQKQVYTLPVATANADGVTFDVSVPALTSAQYEPGTYELVGHVSSGADVHRVETRRVKVTPNITAGQPADTRTDARRILDAIQATIEKRATTDHLQTQIGGRMISRHSLAELVALENRYQYIVDREEGRSTGALTNINSRFSGVS